MSEPGYWLQVGGFLQRIDYVRKYAFGVMAILKNDKGQFPIRGVWIFRGLEIPAIMLDECYDMELYDFVKADINDPVSPPLSWKPLLVSDASYRHFQRRYILDI